MKFWEIFRFELRYQLQRPLLWINIAVLVALVFLFMRDGSLSEAMYTEFFINSPFMVAMATVFGSLLWLLTAAFISGEAAARDIATGMHPLTYTASLTKSAYIGGRFTAAFMLHAIILLFVQIAILLAIYLPGVHEDSLGPLRLAAFLTAYTLIALPNAFAATAIQFGFALRSGRPIAAYVGSLLLFFTAFFIASLILFRKGFGTLLDPIGVRFIWDELSHLWTTVEKSYRLLQLKGTLLQNRLVWISIGTVSLLFTYVTFRFAHRAPNRRWWQKSKPQISVREDVMSPTINAPAVITPAKSFKIDFNIQQTFSIAWSSFKAIGLSWAGVAFLFIIPLLAIAVIIDQMYSIGIPLVPTTARVVAELTGPLSADMSRWMVVPGFIIYFAGELVWRERDYRLDEIVDVVPGSDWAPVIGKFLALCLLLAVFTINQILAGTITQAFLGYTHFEFPLYLKIMFGLQQPDYILFAVLALFIHSVMSNKYYGHLVAIIAYAFIAAIATMLGIEHNLLIYGAGPGWSYTEMRGFGSFIGPWLSFKLYWAAWALLLVALTTLLRTRGKEHSIFHRIRMVPHRLTHATRWTVMVASSLIVAIGGFIFYNTNILNNYLNASDARELRAEYERRYGKYESVPQPIQTAAKLNIDIFPYARSLTIKGAYYFENKTTAAIDSIHLSMPTGGAETEVITFDRKTTLAVDDKTHRYRIYKLDTSLNPGDTLRLDFEVRIQSNGFRNGGIDPSIAAGGAYFTNKSWFPSIGYQRQRGLINPAERRQYGLASRPLLASLSQAHGGDMTSLDDGIAFEAVVSTNDDQVAVAPGALRRSWSANGRRFFHYRTSAPIGSEWAFFSSHYKMVEKTWTSSTMAHRPVVVRVFHHPDHRKHVAHMMNGILASLEYYTRQFGPYSYDHLTFVEHPAGPGTGMHADPTMISYGQGYADWLPEDEHTLDFPYAVIGHEMGHQWTLPYAYVEGLPFLSEGIAWYYGIMMVNHTRSAEQTRRLMSFMRQPYPHQPIRRGEPLLRALDPYLSYKRGPLAMFALSKYAGANHVNNAIRRLNLRSDSIGAPLVTTLDLYHELQATTPDSVKRFLYELFEVNTLWILETHSVKAAKTDNDDQWKVTLDVTAKKIVYDSAGVETEVAMDDWIPIGVFGQRRKGEDELSSPLYLEKHKITPGRHVINVTVSGKPVLGGIDPHHLLDWEEKEDDDNIEMVVVDGSD